MLSEATIILALVMPQPVVLNDAVVGNAFITDGAWGSCSGRLSGGGAELTWSGRGGYLHGDLGIGIPPGFVIVTSECSDVGETGVITFAPSEVHADFNGDGHVNVQDIFDFMSAWFGGLPTADVDADGLNQLNDLFDFMSMWFENGGQ